MIDGSPAVCILAAVGRLDFKLVAASVGASSRVRLVKDSRCVELLGYPPGSVPPFAHRAALRTVVDRGFVDGAAAAGSPALVLGGGAADTKVKVPAAELLSLLGDATVAPIAERAAEEPLQQPLQPVKPGDELIFATEHRRLARWLRAVGVSCEILDGGAPEATIAKAALSNRIVLTRNHKLADRRGGESCFYITSDRIEEQFAEVTNHFGVTFDAKRFMSICSKCNGRGFAGPLSATDAQQRCPPSVAAEVPDRVWQIVPQFWVCRNGECGQIFWVGPKYVDAAKKFQARFPNASNDPPASCFEMRGWVGTSELDSLNGRYVPSPEFGLIDGCPVFSNEALHETGLRARCWHHSGHWRLGYLNLPAELQEGCLARAPGFQSHPAAPGGGEWALASGGKGGAVVIETV